MNDGRAPIRVLHVDDEPDFGALVASFLTREPDRFEVDPVTSADAALARLAADRYDCVVSDFDMPGGDGLELLEAVREVDPELPFILYTGKGSEELASEAISAGVTDYLQKRSGTSQYDLLANRITNAVERHDARQEAIESEQRLRTIAEHTNDVLWNFAADWSELLFVNSPYEELSGRTIEELADDPSSLLRGIHPDDHDHVVAAMVALSNGESVDIEYRANADEDFGRWVWVKGEPILDDDGSVAEVVGFARDVTERKETVERAEALLEQSSDVLTVVDGEGTIRYTSPSAGPVLGYRPEELVGANAFDYIHPDDREAVRESFRAVVERPGQASDRAAYRFRHADGSWVWLETVGRSEVDSVIGGYVLNSRDITERRANERALLERERRLERQNERLDEFASVVSHDLRNPLGVARGRVELLRGDGDGEHLAAIELAHDRMERLIENLLSMARAGTDLRGTEPVALAPLLEACWGQVESGSATLVIDTDATIEADPSRLRQLVENLLRNAVEHAGDDVTVTVGELDDGFYVEDDGPGVPEADRERVLEAGYTTSADGTGFGLSIVRDVAEAHGWALAVTAGSAGGARFEFTGLEPVG